MRPKTKYAQARRSRKSASAGESLLQPHGTRHGAAACYDLACDLAGTVKGLPRDVAVNPKHMQRFGE